MVVFVRIIIYMFKFQVFTVIFLFAVVVVAQDDTAIVTKRDYTTSSLDGQEPPEIDGLLNDSAWNIVHWTGDFIEQRPDENTSPKYQTKFKIIYDRESLYAGIRCYDAEPDKIVRRLSRRDGFEGDWIGVFIDSYNDKRTAFGFVVTVAGVKGDVFESNNGSNEDDSWNPVWYTKTQIDGEGWTAEMKIPLSQLKFGKSQEQTWGLDVMRRFFREEDRSVWQRLPADTPGFVSKFGLLKGLTGIEPQKQMEIQPYAVAKLETYEAESGNPFKDGKDAEISGGLDAKIGI